MGLGSGVQGRAAERLGRAVHCGHLHLGPATGERVTLCVVTGVHRAAVSRGGVQAAAEVPARHEPGSGARGRDGGQQLRRRPGAKTAGGANRAVTA